MHAFYTVDDADDPDPSRHAILLSERVMLIVLMLADEHVMVGYFVDGRFVHSVEGPTGLA
jgi:hypothetical protein